jgi:hypothetical protein
MRSVIASAICKHEVLLAGIQGGIRGIAGAARFELGFRQSSAWIWVAETRPNHLDVGMQ